MSESNSEALKMYKLKQKLKYKNKKKDKKKEFEKIKKRQKEKRNMWKITISDNQKELKKYGYDK